MNKYTAEEIFGIILDCMGDDNGVVFSFTEDQRARAIPPIESLMASGYFEDSPNDLSGSFWQAAGGEETESRAFFARADELDAYEQLNEILNEIFNGDIV